MMISLSKFGQKLCTKTGILELMDDLGQAMSSASPDVIMLGGGNPAAIPEVQATWRKTIEEMLKSSPQSFDAMLANYDPPQGRPEFITAIVKLFRDKYGWKIGPENVAITNGSQSGLFCLSNMLAGEFADGTKKHIVLPIIPEYIGYADQGLTTDFFSATKPLIEELSAHTFKYKVDFKNLNVTKQTALMVVSRPTNPTGNVLTDDELAQLSTVAKEKKTFLLVDNAYGYPFPGIAFKETNLPQWEEHLIYSFSLSKIGLPGTRTGIMIASAEIVRALSAANAVIALANGNIGQAITSKLLNSGELLHLAQNHVRPFYLKRMQQAEKVLHASFDPALPWKVHSCEGALFFWIWLKDMPITSYELYQRLKAKNVIAVPGQFFFYGMKEEWRMTQECIRINYAHAPEAVHKGIKIVADEVKAAYG